MQEHEQREPAPSEAEEGPGPKDAESLREKSGITDPPANFEQSDEVPTPHSRGVPEGEMTDEFGRRHPPEEENL